MSVIETAKVYRVSTAKGRYKPKDVAKAYSRAEGIIGGTCYSSDASEAKIPVEFEDGSTGYIELPASVILKMAEKITYMILNK